MIICCCLKRKNEVFEKLYQSCRLVPLSTRALFLFDGFSNGFGAQCSSAASGFSSFFFVGMHYFHVCKNFEASAFFRVVVTTALCATTRRAPNISCIISTVLKDSS